MNAGMTAAGELDPAIAAIAPEARIASLAAIRHRLADLTFVELLFEKGPREVTMMAEEYSWRNAILLRQHEAAAPPADADDGRASEGGAFASAALVASCSRCSASGCVQLSRCLTGSALMHTSLRLTAAFQRRTWHSAAD